MGLPIQAALILAIVISNQITHSHCVPISPKTSSTQSYLDNLQKFKSNSQKSTSEINSLKQSLEKVFTGKFKNPSTSAYKSKNIPQKEYGFDDIQRDLLFNFDSNYPAVKQDNSCYNTQTNFNKLKRDIKVQRKLQNIINNQHLGQSKNTLEAQKYQDPDSVWSHGMEQFPDIRYPLNIMETWEPHYWDTFAKPQKNQEEFLEFYPIGDYKQKNYQTKVSKIKINPFLQSYDLLKNKKSKKTQKEDSNLRNNEGNSSTAFGNEIEFNSKNDTENISNKLTPVSELFGQNVTCPEHLEIDESKIKTNYDALTSFKSDLVNSAILNLINALIQSNTGNASNGVLQSEVTVNKDESFSVNADPLNVQLPLPLQNSLNMINEKFPVINQTLKPPDSYPQAPITETTIIVFVPPNYANKIFSKALPNIDTSSKNTQDETTYSKDCNIETTAKFTPSVKSNDSDFEKIPNNSICHISIGNATAHECTLKEDSHDFLNNNSEIQITTNTSTNVLLNTTCEVNTEHDPKIDVIAAENETSMVPVDLLNEDKTILIEESLSNVTIKELPIQSNLNNIHMDDQNENVTQNLLSSSSLVPNVTESETDCQLFLELTQPMQEVIYTFDTRDTDDSVKIDDTSLNTLQDITQTLPKEKPTE